MNTMDVMKIRLARQCLVFQNLHPMKCDNNNCQNKWCPLNKFWEEKKLEAGK